MKLKNSLNGYSFMQLSILLAKRKRALAAAKVNRESSEVIALNQKLYDKVKNAIINWKPVK